MSEPAPPLGLLAELSHRCPLRCGYCSNPLQLSGATAELDTNTWISVLDQAAALGVLQVHISGGEPTVRADLEELISGAATRGLYSNLITSGVLLDRERLQALDAAGLDHIQLSIQDTDAASADRIGGHRGAHRKKLEVAEWIGELGIPLTLNAVVHRMNIERVPEMIELAIALGAGRIEVANVQYHGWARENTHALLPTRTQVDHASKTVAEATERLVGRLQVEFVPPDYYAQQPKGCMEGWGRRFLNVTPSGDVLPCHAAETVPGLRFDNVRDRPLAEIWSAGAAFQRFRGEAWMRDPCRTCPKRVEDFGGCRCQALAITGEAENADPVCTLSPHRARVDALIDAAMRSESPEYTYRGG